ncbi:hypothetical protein SBADM41S_05899 [Streptomyces badius]
MLLVRHVLVRGLLVRDLMLGRLRLLPGLLLGRGLVVRRGLVLGGCLLSVPARGAALGLLVGLVNRGLLRAGRLAAGDTGSRGGAEAHPGPVGGVAQVQHRTGAELHLLDPPACA